MRLRHLFYLVIFSLPLYGFPFLSAGRLPFRWDWLFMLCFVGGYVVYVVRGRIDGTLEVDGLLALLFLFNLFLVVPPAQAIIFDRPFRFDSFLTTWIQYLLVSAFFVTVTQVEFERAWIETALRVYVLVTVSVATFGIVQFLLGNIWNVEWIYPHFSSPKYGSAASGYEFVLGVQRSAGIFREPRHFGNFLVTPICVLLASLYAEGFDLFEKRYSEPLLLGLAVCGILVSFSASAYGVLLGSVLSLPVLVSRTVREALNQYVKLGIGALTSAVVVVLSPVDSSPIGDTLQRLVLTPHQIRYLFDLDVRMVGLPRYLRGIYVGVREGVARPFGAGLNQISGEGQVSAFGLGDTIVLVAPAELMVAVGSLGFTIFALFLARHLWQTVQLRQAVRDTDVDFALLSLATVFIVTALAKSITGSRFNYPSTWFWMDLSIAAAIYYSLRSSAGARDSQTEDGSVDD